MITYNDLIGIPFDENNINGVNCYELLRLAFKKHGYNVPATNISVCACKDASNQEIEDHILQYWQAIDKPEIPCGVLILSTNPAFANHIGTYIGNNKILHITKNTNSIIEKMYPKYKHKIIGFYKFIGDK
jgi:cell wall-associated NlpC family hydrolase